MVVTTSINPTPERIAHAQRIAIQLAWRYVERGTLTLRKLFQLSGVDQMIVLGSNEMQWIPFDGNPFSYHPSMAMIRTKRMLSGAVDVLTGPGLADIQAGDRIFDGTCGLGADALVFQLATGPSGTVDACEANSIVAELVRYGLATYQEAPIQVIEAMRKIRVHHGDHLDFLRNAERHSYDVIYFDPMFDQPLADSAAIAPLRQLADHQPLRSEVIEQARRVAKRCVILKDRSGSPWFERFGFQVVKHKSNGTGYGMIDCRALEGEDT
jgi:16S rRNA (guanine1516-N2)-methyltransferase